MKVKLVSDEARLYKVCEMFIKDNQIQCDEDVFQNDKVIENAYGFIAHICQIVGYVETKDD